MSSIFSLIVVFLIFSCNGIEGKNIISTETSVAQLQNDDEFDCVDIYKQPAFDHVLLKNHKIQMRPSFFSQLKRNNKRKLDVVSNLSTKGCPPGNVPIMRTKDTNLTQLRSLAKLHLGSAYPLTKQDPGSHFATLRRIIDDKVYGLGAYIEVFNPPVKINQISSAQIWMENGPPNEINSIQVGWTVHPQLYKDFRTRIFAYWTTDSSHKTGCYNTLCPGFVQVHPKVYLGVPAPDVSIIGAWSNIYTPPRIKKDETSGNWWLIYDPNEIVGYYPPEIFTHLNDGATFVQFGGYTHESPDGLSPPMGNGRFPNKSFLKNCFIQEIEAANSEGTFHRISVKKMSKFADNNTCYDVRKWYNLLGTMYHTLSYGGPGGRCGK